MSDAVITSYTLVDFPTESDMTAFFVFVEHNYEQLANDLRDHGMIKFYITRVFNKEGKFTVGNWLEYKDQDAYLACDQIWKTFMMTVYAQNTSVTAKIAPHRGIVQYDYSQTIAKVCPPPAQLPTSHHALTRCYRNNR